jgi:alkylation response protein AidB-like acyl-CoA dehydrogenase
MDFGLSEEQKALAATVRRYLAERCPTSRVRAVMESETGHDADLWRGLMDLGIGSIAVPEAHGGLGSELLDLALVSEELGYACAPGPFLGCAMATVALAAGDNAEAAAKWLPRLAAGDVLAAAAVGEAGSRWDDADLAATVKDGKLTASKFLVPYGSLADIHVVAARDENGIALWLVERDAGTVATNELSGNDRTRRLSSVEYRGASAERIGGRDAFAKMRDAALVLVAADAYGGARRCLEMARDYALTREQFGQPIGAFQAVKHMCAEMALRTEAAITQAFYATLAFASGAPETAYEVACARTLAGRAGVENGKANIQVHGAMGFTQEANAHHYLKRSFVLSAINSTRRNEQYAIMADVHG